MDNLQEGRRVLQVEAQAILDLCENLDHSFEKAVEMIVACKGKVVCTGMGKSGQIARKISSTMSSTGTPSVFLHPAESSHGDLGIIANNDLIIAISYGGESEELATLLKFASRRDIPLVAMTGNRESTLANSAQVVLDIKVKEEACPMGLAPTTSSTVTLALGDALSMAALKTRGFTEEEYAEYHPGGKLGRRLLTRVKDVMHSGDAVPLVSETDPLSEVIGSMTGKEVQGVAGVLNSQGAVIGVITDGDIRRKIKRNELKLDESANGVMSKNPKTVDANELAQKALFVMEQFRIQTLFVIDKDSDTPQRPVGLLHIQDLIQAKIK